jgi:hypothetical protein
MPSRISVDTTDAGHPTFRIDDEPLGEGVGLRTNDHEQMPFTGIYLNDERQYDVEFWVNGIFHGSVPPQTPMVEGL